MSDQVDTSKPVVERLRLFIGSHPTWKCATDSKQVAGAMATASCSTKVPEHLLVSVFDSKQALNKAYERVRQAQHGPPHGTGGCSATTWGGESVWYHGEKEPGGRLFCYLNLTAGHARLVWVSELGAPTLYQADYGSLNHRTLYFWWLNIRHELF